MMANRMKHCLNDIISEAQSAFIPGRFIMDNAMISFEINHYLKRKTQGKINFASLKTDMSKAYDRVKWDYLKNIMLKLGFPVECVLKVTRMVSTVSYRISHAGKEFGNIIPSRGLRQASIGPSDEFS